MIVFIRFINHNFAVHQYRLFRTAHSQRVNSFSILDPKETENRIRCPEYASVIMEMKEKLLEFYEHGYELMKQEWQNLTDFLVQ